MFTYVAKITGLSTGIIKWVTAALALVAALGSAISAAPTIEPYLLAHRGYVRVYSDGTALKWRVTENDVERTLHNIQVEQAEGKREQADNDLFKAQLEQSRTTDDQTKTFIADQIRKLQNTRDKLDKQLDTLTKNPPK